MTRLARRLASSLNLLTTLVLLGLLFIMVNWVSSRRYARWDVTRDKVTALSDLTTQTLKHLDTPVSIVVFYQPTHRLYELVKDLLAEYERVSDKLKIEYVDPEQDIARAKQLAKQFQIEDLNVVVFEAQTPGSPSPRHKYVSDAELAELDYASVSLGGAPRVKAFKGEEAFTGALLSVTTAQAPLIWVTTGHGEKSAENSEPVGLSEVKRYWEQQNMTVKPVTLLQQTSIPAEVKLVVIAGPTRRFTESEVGTLQAYLDKGGRLLALVDPLEDSGLDGLLERWGITLGMDIVVDPSRQLPFVSAGNLFVTDYTQHPIVEKMKTLMTLFPLARSVRPSGTPPSGLTVTPLALTSPEGWGEMQTSVEAFKFDEGQDLKGPVSIAVAVERTSPMMTRLVAIGDSDFIINGQLGNVGNRDLLMGVIYWLTEQEQRIGIGPRSIESIKLHLTGGTLTGIGWFSFLALPLTCGALGAAVWWVRRQ